MSLETKAWVKIAKHSTDVKQLTKCFDSLPRIDEPIPPYQHTLLVVACLAGNVLAAELLLVRNADPNYRSADGMTPLLAACEKERVEVVRLLILGGADVNLDSFGVTPLVRACYAGSDAVVGALLQGGASPHQEATTGDTPLMAACSGNHDMIVLRLIQAGAPVNYVNQQRFTALMRAVFAGSVDAVVVLLNSGAKIDMPGTIMSAMDVAKQQHKEEMVQLFQDRLDRSPRSPIPSSVRSLFRGWTTRSAPSIA